jgi:A/G-specific adenine glycosylase
VLDGNVARVIARLDAERRELRAPEVWGRLEASAQNLLARNTPGDWNQSMMELGATVCLPKSPLCGECPVSRWCAARRLGVTGEIPVKRRKRAPVAVALAAAVFVDPAGRTLLEKPSGDKGALFSRMWQFPAVEIAPAATGNWAGAGVAALAGYARRRFGIAVSRKQMIPLSLKRHSVTFRRIILVPYLLRVRELPQAHGTQVVLLSRVERLTISNATRKIASSVDAHLAASRHPQSQN